jgi:kynurenine formamidase
MVMPIDLVNAVQARSVELLDLTSPLSAATPILRLPEELGQTQRFTLDEISRFDDRGPTCYWNNIVTGEHTGTHFDAPNHWISGRHGIDVSQVPVDQLVRPAAVLDFAAEAGADPDFLLEIAHVRRWEAENGPLPEGGWLLYRTGWDAYGDDQERFLNGGHTPGVSAECARWLAEETPVIGIGVETVGTDAGAAHSFTPPFPCHHHLQGNGKYGLTQLRNLAALPPTGVVLVVAPLPIVNGSGSPCRVLAMVPR